MYGAPRRTARDAYAWLTAFIPNSPYPVTPAWAQRSRVQPKSPPKFMPFSHGSSYLPLSAYGARGAYGEVDASQAASYVQQATSFVQALVDSQNQVATAQTLAKRDSAVAKWSSKAEEAKAQQAGAAERLSAEQSARNQQTLLLAGGVVMATALIMFFATRKG